MSVKIMQLLAASPRNKTTLPAGSSLFLDRKLILKKSVCCALTLKHLSPFVIWNKLKTILNCKFLFLWCLSVLWLLMWRVDLPPSLCHVVWSIPPAQRLSELEALLSCSTDSPVSLRPYHARRLQYNSVTISLFCSLKGLSSPSGIAVCCMWCLPLLTEAPSGIWRLILQLQATML